MSEVLEGNNQLGGEGRAALPLGAVPTDQSSWSPERIEAEAYRQRALLEALRPNKD